MTEEAKKIEQPAVLDVVALLPVFRRKGCARPSRRRRGTAHERTVLVEFTDDQGRAYAIAPCPRSELLLLHYAPQAA